MTKPIKQRRNLVASFVASAVAASSAALIPHTAQAQIATATLEGHAVPGTRIVATNVDTGERREATATAAGVYSLIGLPAGTYRVTADGQEQVLTLSVASTVTYDFTAQAANLEKVVVHGRRLLDMKTPQVGGLVSPRVITTIPQITRNFLEFADTVPGVTFTVDGQGNTSFRGGAQEAQNANVYIDGMSMKDFIQGGIAGQSGANKNPNQGDPGNPFPQSAIGEYRVITSNYGAEFAQVASAAIAAKTKSGTNDFSGDSFVDFTNQNLRALTPAEANSAKPGDPKAAGSQSLEYGVTFGGPIIKNEAHFFVAYEHKDLSLPNTVFPGANTPDVATLKSLLPASVWSQFGPTTNPFKEDLIFGKLDYEPGINDRLELTELYRFESSINGAQGQTAESAANAIDNRFSRVGLYWLHAADRWTNEARVNYESTGQTPFASSTNPQLTYQWFYGGGNATIINVNGESAYAQFKNQQRVYTVSDDFTLPDLNFVGSHTVKMGVSYSGAKLTYQDAGQGSQFWYAVDSTGTQATPYEVNYTQLYQGGKQVEANSNDKLFGIYLQDDWNVNRHLLFNLGVRYDYETVPSWQNFVTPAGVVAGFNGPYPAQPANFPQPTPGETYAQALALGGINAADYISTGHNRTPQTNEIQPRLGFSYDIQGDQHYVVFGGYARSYDRNIFDLMSLELTKSALAEPQAFFYGGGYSTQGCVTAADAHTTPPPCVAWNPAYLTSLSSLQGLSTTPFGEIDLVNNHIKSPYSDQFSLGFRTQIDEWDASVTLSEVKSYNRIVGQLGNRLADGGYYEPSSWGNAHVNPSWGGVPGTTGNLVLWNNGGEDINKQVLVFLEKPYTVESGWSATIAYTYSDAYQNDYYSYAGNNAYLFDLPKVSMYPFVPSSVIPKHRVVMTGSVDGPWGLTFGAKLSLATPIGIGGSVGCPMTSTIQQCNGYWDFPVTGFPRDAWGEHNLDVQVTKHIDLRWYGMKGYFRLSVLDLFNTPQYDPTAEAFSPGNGPPQYNTSGPIYGVPLTLKLDAGLSW
ncbi:MAG TPA: TonB-dependent receptor [Steroidobacteraceae bacterium]|nr:TonB-dependent receptor [Steroidobacteraceae bacterium]